MQLWGAVVMVLARCVMVEDVEINNLISRKTIEDIPKIGGGFKCQDQVFPGVGEPHSLDGVDGRK